MATWMERLHDVDGSPLAFAFAMAAELDAREADQRRATNPDVALEAVNLLAQRVNNLDAEVATLCAILHGQQEAHDPG